MTVNQVQVNDINYKYPMTEQTSKITFKSLAVFFLICHFIFMFTNVDMFLGIADYYVFIMMYIVCCFAHMLKSKFPITNGKNNFFIALTLFLLALVLAIFFGSLSTGYFYSYLIYSVAFLATINCRFNKHDVQNILNGYIWSAIVIGLYLIIQRYDYYGGGGSRLTIKFLNNDAFDPNFLAAYLLFPGLLSISKLFNKFTLKNAIYTFIIIGGLLLTSSRGAMLSLAVGVFFILIWFFKHGNRRKRFFLIWIIIISLALIFIIIPYKTIQRLLLESYFDNSNSKRILDWTTGLQAFLKNPFLGYGLQSEQNIIKQTMGVTLISHNTYIAILLQFGFVGCCIYVGLLFNFLKFVRKNTVLLGMSLANLMVCFLISAEAAVFFWWPLIIIALLCQLDKEKRVKNSWL